MSASCCKGLVSWRSEPRTGIRRKGDHKTCQNARTLVEGDSADVGWPFVWIAVVCKALAARAPCVE